MPINLTELAKRLGATTMFSLLAMEQRASLLEHSPRRQAPAGTLIADPVNGLQDHLVLLSGALEAWHTWSTIDGRESTYTWNVDVHGEVPGFAILTASRNNTGVKALIDSDYLSISSDEFDALLGWRDLGGQAILAKHRKVFNKVPLESMQQIFERMTERTVSEGETIVTQGEPGDNYYIILSGEAEVWAMDPMTDETTRVAVLRDNDAFGEEALLLEGNRNATVKMSSPGRLLVLSKADFDELLKPRMLDVIPAQQAHDMLSLGQAQLLDCRYPMEYEESRIPGARLVPLNNLRSDWVFTIDPEPTYIVYCRSGRRSNAAAFLLRERGIRVLSLQGGLMNWPYEVDQTPL